MRNAIHPSAVVEDGARLGAGVEIGPFCHIGPEAKLGDGVRLISHVSLAGDTVVRTMALAGGRDEVRRLTVERVLGLLLGRLREDRP